jgi:hypothetical protein
MQKYIGKYKKIYTIEKLESEILCDKLINKLTYYDWVDISIHQKLTEEFIEKHFNKLNCYYVGIYQYLSEEFIEKYHNKLF